MMKKWILIMFVFLLLSPGNVVAHTKIESSNPENGATVTDELTEITLTFGTKIEQGSRFELKGEDGVAINLQEISVEENTLLGTLAEPLENGQYQVNWNIIGADGHIMDGEIAFTVAREVTEEPSEESPTDEENQKDQVSTTEENSDVITEEGDSNAVEDNEGNEEDSPSYVIPVIIVLILVVLISSIVVMYRRKK